MEKIKIFSLDHNFAEGYYDGVINKWLSRNKGIKITSRLQSGEENVTISIFYKQTPKTKKK